MADKDSMSVEEIIAACRAADGGATDVSDPVSDAGADTGPDAAAPTLADTTDAGSAAAPAKDPSQMSVAEILAATRGEKSASNSAATSATPEKSPAKPPSAATKKPGDMSVAEMLAAARREKSGAPTPAPKKQPAPQAAAKSKAAPKEKSVPSKSVGPRDTASVLAASRKESQPGPMSKAEAAEKQGTGNKQAAKEKILVSPMPEKPGYARAPEPAVTNDETRRGFFSSLTGVFVGSALALGFSAFGLTQLLWGLGLARFMFPNILTEPPTRFKVGFPDDFAPGQVATKFKAQFGVWIVRHEYEGQAQIYAIQSVCTHLGCTPNWLEAEQKFKCPCHGSGFYKDGINFEGPAPRPLERFAIRLADDGQLEIDKSRKFQEELGQWADTTSFVPV